MVIQLFFDMLYGVFNLLTSLIDIPSLPDSVNNALSGAMTYIESGTGIIANYCDVGYLLALFGIIISIDIGLAIYHFVLWILKKIPMASVS